VREINEKDKKLTTLAIIGAGILGRSLIYTLAKEQKQFEKITLFDSNTFAFPCTLHSTAIVAPRGLSSGHSPLGDMLMDGFSTFSEHVALDTPEGVQKIIQYTAETEKLDAFKERYKYAKSMTGVLKQETLMARDEAFLIDPETYMDWLMKEARLMEQYHLEVINDLVIDVQENERVHIKTQNGRNLSFDKVIFAGGNYNRFWKNLAPGSKLESSKPVQGSYFEFNQVDWDMDSFSLTLDGDNLIWNKNLKRLLIGSTSLEVPHILPPMNELRDVYERLSGAVSLKLPQMGMGEVKVGLREKARKREPYIVQNGNLFFMGGLYKNGFSLSLKISRTFSYQYL
jgi:glycine/D-amino acid oxidase-like deaminating enzyme